MASLTFEYEYPQDLDSVYPENARGAYQQLDEDFEKNVLPNILLKDGQKPQFDPDYIIVRGTAEIDYSEGQPASQWSPGYDLEVTDIFNVKFDKFDNQYGRQDFDEESLRILDLFLEYYARTAEANLKDQAREYLIDGGDVDPEPEPEY